MKLKHCTFLLLISLLPFHALVAQQRQPEKPKLVVGIMVEGLQHRHIEQLWTRFELNGLKRLAGSGAQFKRMACNMVSAGNVVDIATLMTGTVPYYHGVTAARVYNRLNDLYESVFFDRSQTGIETEQRLSAKNLIATTVLDELILANPNQSRAFAVGIHAEDVIAMGGHASTSVAWVDDVALRWSSTSYYPGKLPWQALEMNNTGAFKRHANTEWTPLFQPSTYLGARHQTNVRPFSYRPFEIINQRTGRTQLKTTPTVNTLVAELGTRLVVDENLGKGETTDMLMLQFTVRTPEQKNFTLQSIEKEDMYLRLDRELQYLMQKLDNAVGEQHVLYFLFGNQNATYTPEELATQRIHSGYFNANRSMALLNTFLMAVYGQERWIQGYYGKHIFLNRKKIEEKKLNLPDFQKVVSDFMLEFEGVQSAHSYFQLMSMAPHPSSDMARVRNSVHRRSAGDVIITLQPGWIERDDYSNPVGESNDIISFIPFYLSGWKIAKQTIEMTHQITDIAPTLTRLMQIPQPNATLGSPISIEMKP